MIVTLLTCSCRYVTTRQYNKDNIRFLTVEGNHDAYHALMIGYPSHPYLGRPAILLRMSDGTVLNTAKLDIQLLAAKCREPDDRSGLPYHDSFCYPYPEPDGTSWPGGTTCYQDLPRVFYVCSNQLIAITIVYNEDDPWEKPEIGRVGGKRPYRFPLKESEVLDVFGQPENFTQFLRPW